MSYSLKIKSIRKYNNNGYNAIKYGTLRNQQYDYQQYGFNSDQQNDINIAHQYGYTNAKPEMDAIPMPRCQNAPVGGFYVEFDCLVEAATNDVTRGFITNYTCNNGDTTFQFLCEIGTTLFTGPTCIYPGGSSGETSYYGNGFLIYEGDPGKDYDVTVQVMHSYLANSYDSSGNNPDISQYTNLISFDCQNSKVYTYTPGLSIYVDGDKKAELDPQKGYGGSQDVIHDTGDTNPSHCSCSSHSCPYPPIKLTHTVTLGKKKGKANDQVHCKLINNNKKGLRCVGNIYITPK
jgi:hypothetical protein